MVEEKECAGRLSSDMSELRLNVGCGKDVLDGWVNVDLFHDDERVVRGDIRHLEAVVTMGTVSAIRAIDVLEHIPMADVLPALKGWFGMLQQGGTVEIRCPDVFKQCELLFDGTWDAPTWAHMCFGGQDSEGNFHKAGFTKGYLTQLLEEAGFVKVKAVSEHEDVSAAGNANFRITAEKPS